MTARRRARSFQAGAAGLACLLLPAALAGARYNDAGQLTELTCGAVLSLPASAAPAAPPATASAAKHAKAGKHHAGKTTAQRTVESRKAAVKASAPAADASTPGSDPSNSAASNTETDPAILQACGADGPTWATLYDAAGQRVQQVQHDANRLIASRDFNAAGKLTASFEREFDAEPGPPVERTVRREFREDGSVRRETVTRNSRRLSQTDFDPTGARVAQTLWNEFGQRDDTTWYATGVVKRRDTAALYDGVAARMVEEFWPAGTLQSRGMFTEAGVPLGLQQRYHRDAAIESEAFYSNGRMRSKREFDENGTLVFEQEFESDGRERTAMRR